MKSTNNVLIFVFVFLSCMCMCVHDVELFGVHMIIITWHKKQTNHKCFDFLYLNELCT